MVKCGNEIDKNRAAQVLIDDNGITLIYNYDINKLGYIPGAIAFKDAFNYPIRLSNDIEMSDEEIMNKAVEVISEGIEKFGKTIADRKMRQNFGRKVAVLSNKRFKGKTVSEKSEIMKKVAAGEKIK